MLNHYKTSIKFILFEPETAYSFFSIEEIAHEKLKTSKTNSKAEMDKTNLFLLCSGKHQLYFAWNIIWLVSILVQFKHFMLFSVFLELNLDSIKDVSAV